MALGNNDQHAQEIIGGALYAAMPKSVLATLAFYLAQRVVGEEEGDVIGELLKEWELLNAQGIIPQKVPSKFARLIARDDLDA